MARIAVRVARTAVRVARDLYRNVSVSFAFASLHLVVQVEESAHVPILAYPGQDEKGVEELLQGVLPCAEKGVGQVLAPSLGRE